MKYQNAFLLFGLAVLAVMLTQLDYAEVWAGLRRAGYWAGAVVALWAALYVLNTAAWKVIIRSITDDGKQSKPVPFWWLYKITVTGFAINYATPGGLMGGEPYRIMALAPQIGKERATAAVILYAMTHIFSHFWFWLVSIVLFLITRTLSTPVAIILALTTAFCVTAIWFFLKGYKRGITFHAFQLLAHFPLIRKRVEPFIERHSEQLATIDQNMAMLHNQNPRYFRAAVLLELACRIASALEIYFIMLVITPDASYIDAIIILAFTSLFANMLFFLPLQLGGREGGFLMSATELALNATTGIFIALIVRIRELIWTGIGLALIKIGK